MTSLEVGRCRTSSVVRTAMVLAVACSLAAATAFAQPQKPTAQQAQQSGLQLNPYVVKYKADVDGQLKANPYGVPIATGGWAGSGGVVNWATTNYYLHKVYPDRFDKELVFRGLYFLFGTHPASNTSLVATVGTRSKHLAYGTNRADFTFIPGVIVPGILILKPDFPENMDDWPFLWGENEGTIGGASQYIFLAIAAQELLGR